MEPTISNTHDLFSNAAIKIQLIPTDNDMVRFLLAFVKAEQFSNLHK